MAEQFTEKDIDVVYAAIRDGECEPPDRREEAISVLRALADAGRLQPQPEPLTVPIDVGTLKALVDLVTGSMDFGSGFLVDEDVDTLRTAAIVLGLDPMDVTPYDYAKRYPHAFEANNNVYAVGGCKVCGVGKPAEVHVLFEVGSTPEESREDHE